ncbi:RNA-binding, CRM domain-containing protein [Quillaja saponaria]|uniref:RNA-binding, CRM domain-containing protein n=1 Tax=Quillaja saponaria TaxID=32244 RepID=A0AAD7M1R6_QUISA|nr:RNA-binding, CRM domain-containing protein [Quillaja saponaria]
MHLHWNQHDTIKVICKPCEQGQVCEYAEELARLSKGIVIDIKPNNTIIFYLGKNYLQPKVMSPPDTLSKDKQLAAFRALDRCFTTSSQVECDRLPPTKPAQLGTSFFLNLNFWVVGMQQLYKQSVEHTSQFIEKLEKVLEEYLKHLARYKEGKTRRTEDDWRKC